MAFTERYVTSAASGGSGTEGAPWTLAEALTNAVAGDRVNIQSDSGYSLGADTVTNVGTIVSAIVFRGYNSSIGDLEGQGRNADGTLNTTNFPVITLTGNLLNSNFSIFEALRFTGSINGDLVGSAGPDQAVVVQCSFLNTANNASARAYRTDNNCGILNCDFECSGASHASVVNAGVRLAFVGNRVKATANTHLEVNNGFLIGSLFFGATSSVGIDLLDDQINSVIYGNTIHNVGIAIRSPNEANVSFSFYINNHITECDEYIDNQYSATASKVIIEINNRTKNNTTARTGIGDGIAVGEITTDTGGDETDFVNAGAGNFRLISAAPGKAAGMVEFADCGAYQREEAGGGGGGMIVHPGTAGGARG